MRLHIMRRYLDHAEVPRRDRRHRADRGAELLTLEEASAVLRTPVATLRYWRHLGSGPDGFRLGRRVLYRREDGDRWVAEQQRAQPRNRMDRTP